MNKLIAFIITAVGLSGCGGGDESLANDVATLKSPYAILDLTTRKVSMRLAVDDLATNAAYRDNQLVFHRLTVGTQDSFVAVFELSQAQWTRIAGTTPWSTIDTSVVPAVGIAGNRPAFNLDYDSTAAAMSHFTLPVGHLDVPTSEVWTAACGVANGWSFGTNPDLLQFQAATVVSETVVTAGGPQPIGERAANANGFYDMHGNVWEWTKPGTVMRGGSWQDPAWSSRAEITVGANEGIESFIPHALAGVRLVLVQQ